jgi:hypothetical protein
MTINNETNYDSSTPKLHKTGSLYGLKFYDELEDIFDVDQNFTCIPNISLLDNNSKIIIDFSSCRNSEDNNFLNSIISGLTASPGGTSGITLSNAKHLDSDKNETSDLSGYFTYNKHYTGVIVADVVSINSVQDYDKLYKNSNFIEIPDFKFSVSLTSSSKQNIVKNNFGTNITPSFSSLGAVKNDYVQFLNGTNKGIMYKIEGISVDSNLHEIISLTAGNSYSYSEIQEEDRFNLETKINVYKTENSSSYQRLFNQSDSNLVSYNSLVTKILVTTTTDSTGSKFLLDQQFISPGIRLTKDSLYLFDLTGVALENGETFLLSSTPDGTHGGGINYTKDVTLYSGKGLVFNPKSSRSLFYYSAKTKNMGNIINIVSDSTGPTTAVGTYNFLVSNNNSGFYQSSNTQNSY